MFFLGCKELVEFGILHVEEIWLSETSVELGLTVGVVEVEHRYIVIFVMGSRFFRRVKSEQRFRLGVRSALPILDFETEFY